MEKRVLEDLISVTTKSSDKNTILKALVKLRIEVVKDKNGIQLFYEAGGIAPTVRLLSKPYEKILEVALSILGNCCTQKQCCKQAISNGIIPPLITILKSISNPKVQCRVCRLLGNLARRSNEKLCTLGKGIGVVVASVLEDTKDMATLSMAIRATRLLWSEMPFYDDFVRSDGVDKILSIFVKNAVVERSDAEIKSLVEQNPYEKERVEFMETHIQIMESINSRVFDHEILKKAKPVDEEGFRVPETPEEHSLFYEILRCLETVTSVPSLRIIYNFFQNQYSCSCVTFFARGDSPFRSYSLRILSNLSKSSGKKVLNDADAMTAACNLITATDLEKPLSESEERHCVCIICFLTDDACNRAKVRKNGALKRLLQLAKNTTSDSFLTMILIGLQHFRYDNMSTDLMIQMGLLNVLINRLDINTKDLPEVHNIDETKNNDLKRLDRDDDYEMDINFPKRVKLEITPPSFVPRDIDSPPASTSSSASPLGNLSPASSSSYSPRSMSPTTNKNVYDDMDDYSPVVSDIEDQNDDDGDSKSSTTKSKRSTKEELEKDSTDLLQRILNEQSEMMSKCELDDGNLSEETVELNEVDETAKEKKQPSSSDTSEKKKTIHLVLSILCSASYRLKHTPLDLSLCKPEILDTLVKTCRLTYKRRSVDAAWDSHGAPLVLAHIVSETKNFVPLLKHNFIFQIYEMANPSTEHRNCSLCTDLKYVGKGLMNLLNEKAETGYGRGEMAHFLLKDDKEMHKQVSIISAIIIRDPKILNTLLVKHGGLYTIVELILTKNEKLSSEAAIGLTAVARQLQIKTPTFDLDCISKCDLIVAGSLDDVDEEFDDEEDVVSFVGGTNENEENTEEKVIKFSKKILTENSDVFDRMLSSDFQESKNKQVVLKKQSIEGIKYFLDCIKQHSMEKPLRKPIAKTSDADGTTIKTTVVMKAALEAYDMCQIYLLPELEKNVFNMIVYLLDADNILELFVFSMRSHKQELTDLSINYFLTSNMSADKKVKVFRAADDCDFFKEWNEMILDTIVYTCQNHIM